MSDLLPSLLTAIMDDDRGTAKESLSKDPLLSGRLIEEASYESRITHWIYAGDTALHVAAAAYRVEIANMLLAAGADPNAARNHRRSRPLHYASDGCLDNPTWDAKRQVAIIRILLEAGADLHAQDKNGATPLHRAVRTRCAATVACLLEAGSDVNMQNKSGSTPFHLAVQNTGRGGSGAEKARAEQREIIQAFLAKGVRPALKDRKGKSVLQWARSGSIRELLQPHA